MKKHVRWLTLIVLLLALTFTLCACDEPKERKEDGSTTPNNDMNILPDDNYPPASEGLRYTLNSDKASYSVAVGTCTDTNIVIPYTYQGLPVTSISDEAFYNCSSLTSVTIPDSVTSIGDNAFYGCDSLTSITIPDSVTSIGNSAFYSCSSLTSITILDSVTSIGNYAFYSCSSLTNITIPDSVISIGDDAFSYCRSLTSITIPDSVTSIGDDAFSYCRSLTSITIPDSVMSIGYNAFYGCANLIQMEIGVSYVDKWVIDCDTNVASVTLRDNTVGIGDDAFYNCSSLTSITIPDSVMSIGYNAFHGCSRLTSITIPFVGATKDGTMNTHFRYIFGESSYSNNYNYVPSSLKTVVVTGGDSIGNYAFYNCSSLTSITIPDNVTSIGDHAFRGCSSLTSITIPDSVTSIGDWAFSNCDSLSTVYYSGTAGDWGNISIGSSNFALTSATRYYYSETEPTGDGNYWRYVDGVPTPW